MELGTLGGQLLTMLGSVGGTALFMRQFMSRQRLALAGDSADVRSINRLLEQLEAAEKRRKEVEERADKFADERNQMFREMADMRAEMERLRSEVHHLTIEVQRLRGETP